MRNPAATLTRDQALEVENDDQPRVELTATVLVRRALVVPKPVRLDSLRVTESSGMTQIPTPETVRAYRTVVHRSGRSTTDLLILGPTQWRRLLAGVFGWTVAIVAAGSIPACEAAVAFAS
jgi:hypothetical protein